MNESPATAALAQVAPDELARRREFDTALCHLLVRHPSLVYLPTLKRALAHYYGASVASYMSRATLIMTGLSVTKHNVVNRRLVPPSRAELARIRAQWTKDLPPGEIPMIRRGADPGRPFDGIEPYLFEIPEGTPRKNSVGVNVQTTARGAVTDMRDGGTGKTGGGTRVRRRRFPAYLEGIRAILATAKLDVVDRDILEHTVNGRSLRWIGDEMGLSYEAIRKRMVRHTKAAGLKGPGPGR